MHHVYSKYRDMKREIRNSAAIDIQRIIRSYLCRKSIRKHQTLSLQPINLAASSDSVLAAVLAVSSTVSTGNFEPDYWKQGMKTQA
jgi:hypothetical protein